MKPIIDPYPHPIFVKMGDFNASLYPLHNAALQGNMEKFEQLLTDGEDVNNK
jgi:hypothetical protein